MSQYCCSAHCCFGRVLAKVADILFGVACRDTMVLKTTLCRFSGLRIWPGRGILFIRVDNQQYLFLNKKCKSLYHNRLRPAKLAWTTTYRLAGLTATSQVSIEAGSGPKREFQQQQQ